MQTANLTSFNLSNVARALVSCLGFPKILLNIVDEFILPARDMKQNQFFKTLQKKFQILHQFDQTIVVNFWDCFKLGQINQRNIFDYNHPLTCRFNRRKDYPGFLSWRINKIQFFIQICKQENRKIIGMGGNPWLGDPFCAVYLQFDRGRGLSSHRLWPYECDRPIESRGG